jgi:hypothetical protein
MTRGPAGFFATGAAFAASFFGAGFWADLCAGFGFGLGLGLGFAATCFFAGAFAFAGLDAFDFGFALGAALFLRADAIFLTSGT